MGITHVLRGEDLLPSTPRQIALYEALIDIGRAEIVPEFGHLPFVTGEGNRKLSKRDPQSNLFQYRDDGFITEGMVNYLALLGWSLGEDRDIFSPAELVAAFDGKRISGNPARFDRRKAEAINGAHLRLLTADDFAARLQAYLVTTGAAARRADGRISGSWSPRPPRWSRSDRRCCPRPPPCCGSCSSVTAPGRRSRASPSNRWPPTRC